MITPKISRSCYLVISLLFFSLEVFSQTDITGRVVDENNGAPLANASVCFNNTTIGTHTDENGEFRFETIRMLNTEIVIFSPGYEVLVYKPDPGKVDGKRIVFKLLAKAAALAQDKPELTEEARVINMEFFHTFFLGITDEAKHCKIINENAIYFTRGTNASSFIIKADTPLVIINSMLGYKINYYLEEFSFDTHDGKNTLSGYAFYESMGDNVRWLKNRDKCYYGSTLHFYRSLVNHRLYEENFGTFLLKPLPKNAFSALPDNILLLPGEDTLLVEPVGAQELLFIDSTNEMTIHAGGKLLVQYYKDPPAKFFLMQQGFYLPLQQKGVESYISFQTSPLKINYKGVLDDYSGVEYRGYWIYEKVANTLPFDYQPVK
jgi:hypothetical protein